VNRTITAFRGAMVSIIYAKTLELPAGLYDESAALTLMSIDVDRLTVSLDSLNEVWARVIEMSIGIWLLERRLGWVCVVPIVIVAISVYASAHVTKRIGPRQAQWVKAIQRRVGITSSMLGFMKSVKMMGLSRTLFDTLHNHRIRELNLSKHFRMMGLWRMLLCECFNPIEIYPTDPRSLRPANHWPVGLFRDFCHSVVPSRLGSIVS
jgi:ATP-binding cassette subfamily C (CFTR/MRP) protein 1